MKAGAASVSRHSFIDLDGEGQGPAAIFAGDPRSLAGTNAFEERLNFQLQRLSLYYCGFVHGKARWKRGSGSCCRDTVFHGGLGEEGIRRNVDDQKILARVVNRDVLVGLEKPQFPDALSTDAARGKVCDAA